MDKPTGRTKPRYNPKPNAKERAHHLRVMGLGCLVTGGDAIAHHILQPCVGKRWRRDHAFVVPIAPHLHTELHDVIGDEIAWQNKYGLNLADVASFLRLESMNEGVL